MATLRSGASRSGSEARSAPPSWCSRSSTSARSRAARRRIQLLLTLTLPLYLAIVAIAIHPGLAEDVGIHLKPLETEAIFVSLLLFLGINYAWLLFMEPAYEAGEAEGALGAEPGAAGRGPEAGAAPGR